MLSIAVVNYCMSTVFESELSILVKFSKLVLLGFEDFK